jgi:hypothetical protein
MRFLVTLLLLTSCSYSVAQEQANDDGLKAAGKDLVTLLTFKLDTKGALRLNRAQWETVFEEPKEPEPEKKPANAAAVGRAARMQRMLDLQKRAARMPGMMGRQDPIHHKMLNRVMSKAGARSGGRGMSGTSSDGDFRGTAAAGRYVALNESLAFQLEELAGACRWISVSDSDSSTSLTLSSNNVFIQITRRKEGVQIASVVDGKSDYFAASSFKRLVHENKQYFQGTIAEAIKDIASLPIDEALKTEPLDDAKSPEFTDMEFPEGKLAEDKVRKALMPLVQFRLMDGRPRLHRESGDDKLLQKELTTLKDSHARMLEEAIARLRAGGGTEFHVGELRRQMGLAGDQVTNRRFGGGSQIIELQMFSNFRTLAGDAFGGSSSGGGNGTWRQSFGMNRHDKGGVGGRILVSSTAQELEVKDGGVRVSITDNEDLTRIVCESDSGFIMFRQTDEPSQCEMVIVGGGKVIALTGDSFAAMLNSKRVSFHRYALRTWKKYGIGGLNPFSKDTIKAVLKGIAEPDSVPAIAESLVNDREYLTMLVDQVDEESKATIQDRVASLK